ncbi:MAG: FtsH protease activity modulator HflK [Gammaproteobacteria bacterium]
MAWNEPGGNNRDPWGGGGRNDQGPPDLDEVLRKLQDRLGGLFGGGGNQDGGTPRSGGGRGGSIGIGVILIVVLALWLFTGFYTVDEGEQGVVLRFGKHVETTEPGLRWHIPTPIEVVEKVDVKAVRSAADQALMLTGDENIAVIKLEVQYQVKDAAQYLFAVRDPDITLEEATASAMREAIGQSLMDTVLTSGRAEIESVVEQYTQSMLDDYQTGLIVTKVNLEDAQAPEEVQDAFADAIKAREDKDRFVKQAEAYANSILPKARGQAQRLLKEAEAYQAEVIARAEGETQRFNLLLSEYKKAPDITRERLYIDAVQNVLERSSKVMLDVDKGNNLVYLPLDKIISGQQASNAANRAERDARATITEQELNQTNRSPRRSVDRGREVRR